jgi:hypothetical protein
MAKFLDKKEQVIDFQLTPYGNYLLSTGIFKPAYYAFYDSNILYDKQYARGTYCKSASCGSREVTKVLFVSNTRSDYSSMAAGSDGVYGPTRYLTAYNGSTPYIFWFKTADSDVEPGTGVIGEKPVTDLRDTTSTKEEIAFKFYKDLNNTAHLPFTVNHNAGTNIVFLTASTRGPSTDVTQTIDGGNIITASVYVQGYPLESFRAFSDVPVENQNEIEKRIKDETQYLEGFLAFTDLEEEPRRRKVHSPLGASTKFAYDVTAIREYPQKDIFKFDSAIGDVRFDNEKKQTTPAWKMVALAGQISSSTAKDEKHDQLIPQINVDMMYSKEIKDIKFDFEDSEVFETIDTLIEIDRTKGFADKKTIALEAEHLLLYTEELNSEFLTENFDIEVYEVLPGVYNREGVEIAGTEKLRRKFFTKNEPQIVDGMMTRATPDMSSMPTSYTTSSVEYYFDIYTDLGVDKKIACQGSNIFNKDSYYIDIDFECEPQKSDDVYYDIYGRATDPELCQT